MPIRVLDASVVGRIAAGEVVERPSSVVKELVENSLDAGATSITVEIKGGGIDYLRVTDNGCGIEPSQVRLAFENHATSKLQRAEQLDDIRTLGFRGEALPSIAAVSRVEMTTRAKGAPSGVKFAIEGGKSMGLREAGCPEGTTIVMRDLFYNVPVRRAFLKKPSYEGGLVSDAVSRLLLGNPGASMRFISNGVTLFHSFGDGKLRHAVFAVYGRETAEGMVELDAFEGGVRIHGLIGVGELAKATRAHELFFINGRSVRCPLLSKALEQVCRSRVTIGMYPMCVLNLVIPPNSVDVNVHPNKLEVRFRDEDMMRAACERLLARAFEGERVLEINKLSAPGRSVERSTEVRELPVPGTKQTDGTGKQTKVENSASLNEKQTSIDSAVVEPKSASESKSTEGANPTPPFRPQMPPLPGRPGQFGKADQSCQAGQSGQSEWKNAQQQRIELDDSPRKLRESLAAVAEPTRTIEVPPEVISRPNEGPATVLPFERKPESGSSDALKSGMNGAPGQNANIASASIMPEQTASGVPGQNANIASAQTVSGPPGQNADIESVRTANCVPGQNENIAPAQHASAQAVGGAPGQNENIAPAQHASVQTASGAPGQNANSAPAQHTSAQIVGGTPGQNASISSAQHASAQTVGGASGQNANIASAQTASGALGQNANNAPTLDASGQNASIAPILNASAQTASRAPQAGRYVSEAQISNAPGLRTGNSQQSQSANSPQRAPYRLIGVAFRTYILVESGDALILIDQHAAHERLQYERYMARAEAGAASQQLLTPLVLTVSARELAAVEENQEALAAAGYEVEPFGDREIRVTAVPFVLGKAELKPLFLETLQSLSQLKAATLDARRGEIMQMACKSAVKGGDALTESEIAALIEELQITGAPPTCPHGRPVAKVMTRRDLEKLFKRIQ